MTRLGPPFTRSTCRACGEPVYYGEAIPARKMRPKWRHGFVHRSCYAANLRAKEAAQARALEAIGQGRLFS